MLCVIRYTTLNEISWCFNRQEYKQINFMRLWEWHERLNKQK